MTPRYSHPLYCRDHFHLSTQPQEHVCAQALGTLHTGMRSIFIFEPAATDYGT